MRAQVGHGLDDQREAIGQLIAGPAVELDALPIFRAIMRNPSCLISISHSGPTDGCGADVGRHGGIKPAGRERDDILPLDFAGRPWWDCLAYTAKG